MSAFHMIPAPLPMKRADGPMSKSSNPNRPAESVSRAVEFAKREEARERGETLMGDAQGHWPSDLPTHVPAHPMQPKHIFQEHFAGWRELDNHPSGELSMILASTFLEGVKEPLTPGLKVVVTEGSETAVKGLCDPTDLKSTRWSAQDEKAFEVLLNKHFDLPAQERWVTIARSVNRTPAEVCLKEQLLIRDLVAIGNGVSVPSVYKDCCGQVLRWNDVPITGSGSGVVDGAAEKVGTKGVPWEDEEHLLFLMGLEKLGKGSWVGISQNYVLTRNPSQVASHAQKFFRRQAAIEARVTRNKRRRSIHDLKVRGSSDGTGTPLLQWSEVAGALPCDPAGGVSINDPIIADGLRYIQNNNPCKRFLESGGDPNKCPSTQPGAAAIGNALQESARLPGAVSRATGKSLHHVLASRPALNTVCRGRGAMEDEELPSTQPL